MADHLSLSKDHGHQMFFKSSSEGDIHQLKSILEAKLVEDVNIRDHQGWTALMLAARNGHSEIALHLLEQGVVVDGFDLAHIWEMEQVAILDAFFRTENKEVQCLKDQLLNLRMEAQIFRDRYWHILRESKADVSLISKSGQTAFQIAEFWNHEECCKVLDPSKSDPSKVLPSKEVVNFFGTYPLDRQALRRADQSWLEASQKNPTTKYILLSKQNPYTLPPSTDNRKYSLCTYNYAHISHLLENISESSKQLPVILLGSELQELRTTDSKDEDDGESHSDGEGCVWFAIDVTAASSDEIKKLRPEAELLGSNFIALMGFDESEAGILAQAISILSWHDRYKFCPTCGCSTVMEEAGYKRKCENTECRSLRGVHNTSYPRLDPVAIMLVIHPDGDKCLLGRKKMFPKGMFSCLAGFMEPGESIENAVRREVKEESGIDVGRVKYHSSQPWPMPSQIMIGCLAWATSTSIVIDEQELQEAKWFGRQEVFEAVTHGHKGYTDRGDTGIFVPPKQAIAHQLIKAWAMTSANL